MKNKFLIVYHDIIRDLKGSFNLFFTIVFCMLLSISSLVGIKSFITYREALNANTSSNYDLIILDVPYSKYMELYKENDPNIENLSIIKVNGYAKLEDNYLNKKNYILIESMRSETFENEGFLLSSGRLPQTDHELLIPEEYANIYNINIGDIVFYNIGDLYVNDELYVNSFSRLDKADYEFKESEEQIYTVVGEYTSSKSLYIYNTELNHYYAYTFLNSSLLTDDTRVDVAFNLYDNTNIELSQKTYGEKLSSKTNSNIWVLKNNIVYEQTPKAFTYIVTIILLLSISMVAIKAALEYHNFDRRKFFGQSMSLGATSEGIKAVWDLETFIIIFLGIIFGICISIITLYGFTSLFIKTNNEHLLKNMLGEDTLLYSSLIIAIAMIIANRLSIEKIIYVNPLDYLKTKYESIEAKFIHYSGFTKLRGEINKYVTSNFQLKKIMNQVFVFGSTFSVALILMLITINLRLTSPIMEYLENKPITINLKIDGDKDYLDKLNEIKNISSVKDYSIYKDLYLPLYTKKSYIINSIEGNQSIFNLDKDNNKSVIPLHITIITDEEFNKYVNNSDSNVIVDTSYYLEVFKDKHEFEIYDDINKPNTMSIYTNIDNEEKEIKSLNNLTYLNMLSKGLNLPSSYENIVIRDSYFKENLKEIYDDIKYNTIKVVVDNEEVFLNSLNEYAIINSLDISIIGKSENIISNSIYIYISFASMLLAIVFSLIVFYKTTLETVYNYTKGREKELAILRTVGASSKNIYEVINKEFGKGYFISAVSGTVLGFIINKIITEVFTIEEFKSITSSISLLVMYIVFEILIFLVFYISLNVATKDLRNKYPIEFLDAYDREF